MRFAIGNYDMLDIEPMPDLPKRRLSLVERPGVDGTALWDIGRHGRPCTVRSRVDQADLATALDTYSWYCELIDGTPTEVIFSDQSMAALGAKYQVLDCRLIVAATIVGASGGLNAPSEGWLECEWDLLPVPAE